MYCRVSFRRLKEAGGGRGTNCVGGEGVGRRKGRRREGAGGGGGEKGREREVEERRESGREKQREEEWKENKREEKRWERKGGVCGGMGGRGGNVNPYITHLLQLMHRVLTYLQLIIRGHHLQFIELAYLLRVHVLLQLPCGIFVWERAPLDEIVCYNLTIGLCL